MTDFIDQFVERRGLETSRKLIHRHGFKAILAMTLIREGAAETMRILRQDSGLDPARIADPATTEAVLRRLDAAWIAARLGSEPHKVREALATLVPDLLLALQELYKSTGSLQSVFGEPSIARAAASLKRAAKPERAFVLPSWTLDLIAV